MSWLYLAAAIVFELIGSFNLKASAGFTNLIPSILMFSAYAVSFTLAGLAVKVIDLSVAYAIWSGVGTAATAAIGILYFKEPATAIRLVSLALIVLGVVGLNLGPSAK